MGSRMVNHLLDAGTNVVAFDTNRWAATAGTHVSGCSSRHMCIYGQLYIEQMFSRSAANAASLLKRSGAQNSIQGSVSLHQAADAPSFATQFTMTG
jgi:3-hydroxyisobutyrate dehydrogenase-like beta-hydroxyacid dehydrogenase